jgi:di/tricarboxylate transporter
MKSTPINLWFLVSVAIAAMVVIVMLLTQSVPREVAFMAGILALAALLWMTEAVTLFATSLLVISLQILLLANPGGWPGLGFEDQQSPTSPTYQQVLAAAADPVLVLFFGGLLLARAATKEKVDQAFTIGGVLKGEDIHGINHMESGLPENDSRPLPRNATRVYLTPWASRYYVSGD